ncbi:Sas10 C-terminal domain-containing protein [Trichoderma novae-zelandiae]
MAKKRSRAAEASGPKELDPADARLKVTSYEDLANSEDEFFINRDTIMLDDEPNMKRRRKGEEEIEFSDEEVLGYEESDSGAKPRPSKSKRKAAAGRDFSEDEEDKAEGEEGDESSWWGASKKEYYNADNIETEADALEEENEAKRLQQKKLSKMAEEDFIFDGDEWLAGEQEAEESAEPVTEVLKEVEITDDMGPEERLKLLSARYPEFDYLVKDFQELQPQLEAFGAEAKASDVKSLAAIKYWVLGCYVASLAGYLAILTSPARDAAKAQKTIDPAELRDHDVMETLVQCREAWERVKDLRSLSAPSDASLLQSLDAIAQLETEALAAQTKAKKAKKAKKVKEITAAAASKAKAIEETVADLYDLPINTKSKAKSKEKSLRARDDDSSDFGEEEALDARAAADKAARKKSLKFYTSQIVQKANRRAGAGRDAGGDMDIPHRERLRDRQARLLAEAEKRGKRDSKLGANLGDDSDEEDSKAANAMRDDEDEYYDMVAHGAKAKKEDKAARYAAYAAASKADRVVPTEEIGEDGKRKITYAIQKNKGLAPRRNKDVRNPRVKRRKQYEAKQKKLKSIKPVWQGGEPKGGYQGETSGINATVVKSIKL